MKPWTLIDKLLWKVMRWATKLVVRPLVFLKITPNQLTFFSSVINFSLAALCFVQGQYLWNLAGLFFLILHSYFDFADGTLARATNQTSKLGGWLDPKLDVLGSELVILAIIFGFIRSDPGSFWLIIAFLVLLGRMGLLAMVTDYLREVYQDTKFIDRFRTDKKITLLDKIIKNFITLEPFPFLFLGTFRYFLPLILITNQIKIFLLITAIFSNLRWIIMFWTYSLAFGELKTNVRAIKLLSKIINKK